MYLWHPEMKREDVWVLWGHVMGYLEAEETARGSTSEYRSFLGWLEQRDPELVGSPSWFGEVLLRRARGDHQAAIQTIGSLAREYLAENQP